MKPFAFPNTGYKKPIAPLPLEKVTTLAAGVATPLASTTDVLPWKSPPPSNIFMQNQQPSCLADGVCQMMEYKIWLATGSVVRLSRRFLWALCVKNDKLPIADGTYMQTAIAMAEQYGVCEARYFDDDTTLPLAEYADASQISIDAYANALQYRVDPSKTKFLSDLSFSSMASAIFQNGLVLTAMQISDQWWTAPSGEISWAADDILPLRPIDATHPEVSGHCVVLYAYDQLQHYILNWWSAEWGYNGRGWYRLSEAPALYEAAILDIIVSMPVAPAPVSPTQVEGAPTETILEKVEEEIKSIL